MNASLHAVRMGVRRGLIELRHSFTTTQELLGYIFPVTIFVVVLFFMRNATVPGTNFSLGASTLPSLLGMGVAFSGLATIAQQLTIEREDGTLLRAKATPNGMLGYLALRLSPPRWHWPALLAASAIIATVGWSRVALQVHYASDVLAAWGATGAWLAGCVGLGGQCCRPAPRVIP